jgi:TP901 family phage tail tape measure protein
LSTVANLMVKINSDISGLEKGLGSAQQKLQNFGGGMVKTGGVMTAGITAPIVAGVAAVGKLTNEAMGFQQQMNEVFTLMPGITGPAMDTMTSDVLGFAKEMGVIPNEVAPALYQAISAGVPADNVFSFLETAQKAAVGGVTDLTTAVDGISTVINSYGEEIMDAGTASDLMFTAVRLGKTTFEELSASLFNVLPSASSLGVGFDEVTAAIASMTAQGVPTSVATTQMRQMLVELSKEGGKTAALFEELSGKSFKDFIASGGDVGGALAIMDQYAKDNNQSINDLFGSVEAGNAALQLSGENAQSYADNLREMQGAAGATDEAFEKMEQGVGRQLEKLKAEFATLMIEIGDKFLPVITDTLIPVFRDSVVPVLEKVADAIKKAAEWFGNLSPKMQGLIIGGVALLAALGPILVVVGGLVIVLGALMSPIGLIIIAFLALVAATVAIVMAWKKGIEKSKELWGSFTGWMSEKLEATKEAMQVWADTTKELIVGAWQYIRDMGGGAVGEMFDKIVAVFTAIWDFTMEVWGAITAFFGSIWEAIKALFRGDLDAVQSHLTEAFTGMQTFTMSIWERIAAFFGSIWDKMKQAVITKAQEIYTNTRQKFEELWTYIKGIPAQALSWGRDIIQSIWDGISQKWSDIKTKIAEIGQSIKDAFNPWAKHSPSLIDNIRSGIREIENAYGSISIPALGPVSVAAGVSGSSGESRTVNFDLNGLFAGANISIGSEEQAREVAREIFRMAKGRALSEGVAI